MGSQTLGAAQLLLLAMPEVGLWRIFAVRGAPGRPSGTLWNQLEALLCVSKLVCGQKARSPFREGPGFRAARPISGFDVSGRTPHAHTLRNWAS